VNENIKRDTIYSDMKNLLVITILGLCCFSAYAQESIKANMLVNVSVAGVPEGERTRVTNQYLVDGSGYLRLPLIDEKIKASGLSAPKLAVKLADVYKKAELYSSPVFTVTTFKNNAAEAKLIREVQNREQEIIRLRDIARAKADRLADEKRLEVNQIHVIGHAKAPGPYKLTHGMTIGIALSHGRFDAEWGSSERIILKRGSKTYEYNYKKNPAVLEYKLQANDFIEIPAGKG